MTTQRKHSITGAVLCHHHQNPCSRKKIILLSILIQIIILVYLHHLINLLEFSFIGRFQYTPQSHGVAAAFVVQPNTAFYSTSHLQQRTLHKINIIQATKIHTLNDIHDIDNSNNLGLLSTTTNRDDIQQHLVSPAPESFTVLNHRIQKLGKFMVEQCNKNNNDDNVADVKTVVQMDGCRMLIQDIQALCQFLVKPGISIDLNIVLFEGRSASIKDIIWTTREETDLKCDRRLRLNRCQMMDDSLIVDLMEPLQHDVILPTKLCHQMSCLEISHKILNSSISKSSRGLPIYDQEYDENIKQLEERMRLTLGSDLRGRISADTAYNLALSGMQKSNLILDALVDIGIYELQRVGQRSSFKSKFILQMVEKFAITGASLHKLNQFYVVAAKLLEFKGHGDMVLIENLLNGEYGLFSKRPLLWLWRFSSRQKKLQPNVIDGDNDDDNYFCWKEIFSKPSNDLIVDIGCGMGVSLLNAATCSRSGMEEYDVPKETADIDWANSNYLGVDLNNLMTNYANGIVSRSDMFQHEKCIHFFPLPGDSIMKSILSSYPGKVSLVMIQFPSPYRLETIKSGGNEQLPLSAQEGFMVNEKLLHVLADVLKINGGRRGKLLFQTKCEDVAVYMKNIAIDTGRFELISCHNSIFDIETDVYDKDDIKRPRRVDEWLNSNPNAERAEGIFWSTTPLFPHFCKSETEIACEADGTFVHRCIMEASDHYLKL